MTEILKKYIQSVGCRMQYFRYKTQNVKLLDYDLECKNAGFKIKQNKKQTISIQNNSNKIETRWVALMIQLGKFVGGWGGVGG